MLFFKVAKHMPKSILEVGVYRGQRSEELIRLAFLFSKTKIKYYGFDLFEDLSEDKLRQEYSKISFSKKHLENKLNENVGFFSNINLIKGDTKKTLQEFKFIEEIDFFFIDGGHSIDTINSDFEKIYSRSKVNSVIILDDYYIDSPELIKNYGCNSIITKYPNQIFEESNFTDKFKKNELHSLNKSYSIKMISTTK